MPHLSKRALNSLVCSFATCGGDRGPLFLVAKALRECEGGELRDIVPEVLVPLAENSLMLLEKEAIDGEILPRSVLRRYGLPDHFRDMKKEAEAESRPPDGERLGVSVAVEVPPGIRPLAHTLLPIVDGVYENCGKMVSFEGLVPLGPQEGQLVVHLAGLFSIDCSKEEIVELLEEQSRCPELMDALGKVARLDYGGTKLREATIRAKESLGL